MYSNAIDLLKVLMKFITFLRFAIYCFYRLPNKTIAKFIWKILSNFYLINEININIRFNVHIVLRCIDGSLNDCSINFNRNSLLLSLQFMAQTISVSVKFVSGNFFSLNFHKRDWEWNLFSDGVVSWILVFTQPNSNPLNMVFTLWKWSPPHPSIPLLYNIMKAYQLAIVSPDSHMISSFRLELWFWLIRTSIIRDMWR